MTHVYTGNGKGKTTAALGLSLRAAGQGLKVEVIQFMKDCPDCGEYRIINKLSSEGRGSINVAQFGTGRFSRKKGITEDDVRMAEKGMECARCVIRDKKPDVIVLDEINVAMDFNVIKKDDVKKLLGECGPGIEVVLTGRGCPAEITQMADYVTEMKEIKHPHAKGAGARKGIEY